VRVLVPAINVLIGKKFRRLEPVGADRVVIAMRKSPPDRTMKTQWLGGSYAMKSTKGRRKGAAYPIDALSAPPPLEPTLDRDIQNRIGDNLRIMYDDLLQKPIPERFYDLLNKLDGIDGDGSQS
jgi:hypothetical protein